MNTIGELLARRAAETPEAIAIAAVDGRTLRYGELAAEVERTAAAFRAAGVAATSRIAITLPNGPELAVTLLGAFTVGQCAPLNPAYSEREFEFYLSDLDAAVLVVAEGEGEAARAAAAKQGVRILELRNRRLDAAAAVSNAAAAAAEDVALVLHTSGTTARPKVVPLTHRNLCESAANIAAAFELTASDRCLQVMPLFHVHGLIGALLSSITAGAAVVCTPGFDARRFRGWLEEFRPSWYTAVPTIHQAVLQSAGDAGQHSLRFIRSCSSPLAPVVMAALEEKFGVPVVESYGMTEGAHQIATNPLPPLPRKPGSVGRAAGPQIAILDDGGRVLGRGEQGEVAIRGRSVTSGYAANPAANAAAFTHGWFRTGDRGYLDEDGYLFLVGRIKEIINRGGEKISPREIDEAFLEHPAVAEAVAFAIPDPAMGEEIGAAIVLKAGAMAREAELREHVASRLAYFKVPRRIVILDAIPKGPTGKPQRIGMASRIDFGAAANVRLAARTSTATEQALLRIWEEVLGRRGIGVDDNFFDLGGDSLRAAQVAARARDVISAEIPIAQLFASPTIAQLAGKLTPAGAAAGRPVRRERPGVVRPLSFAQEALWFMAQLREDDSPAIRPLLFRLRGEIDEAALEASLRHVIDRHEALRTRIVEDDGIPIGMLADASEFRLTTRDVAGAGDAERYAAEQMRARFDLARDLPVRAWLLRVGDGERLLGIAMHHACSDGWSNAVLYQEISACYRAYARGGTPDLTPVPLQYADYAEWQRERLGGAALERKLAYWKQQLDGSSAEIRLPFDRARPERPDMSGGRVVAHLDAAARDAVRAVARAQRSTPFVVLLACFFERLHRWSGDRDLVVGVPAANRPTPEAEQAIGLFMNPMALRCAVVEGESFRELAGRVRDVAVAGFEHQDAPLEKVVRALARPRARAFQPIYRVGFQLRNYRQDLPEFPGVEVERLAVDLESSFADLALEGVERDDGIELTLIYNAAVFRRETAVRLLDDYRAAVSGACAVAQHASQGRV